jgi:hypothetical protein
MKVMVTAHGPELQQFRKRNNNDANDAKACFPETRRLLWGLIERARSIPPVQAAVFRSYLADEIESTP